LFQIGLTRDVILPEIYRDQLKVLWDQVPAIPGDQAREMVEKALGKPIHDVFDSFEDIPIGAASIGQVRVDHHA
jgi:predicted unusual protein kinase regulating ubiquinone biosynthesis (AarF/ABC1/UbiB family)